MSIPTTEPNSDAFAGALTAGPLARPLDPNALSNDQATLRALCGMLNDPRLTGAEAPPDGSAPSIKFPSAGKPLAPESPTDDRDNSAAFKQAAQAEAAIMAAANSSPLSEPLPQIARPARLPAKAPPPVAAQPFVLSPGQRRIFFTGASRAGKSWLAAQLGARVMELEDPIRAMAAEVFGDSLKEEHFIPYANEVFAWGEGTVSTKYPVTAARAMFINNIRSVGPEFCRFGLAGFWEEMLLERVESFQKEFPGELVVVTDIGTVGQYKFLRERGFAAFHVTCNNITRRARGGIATIPALVQAIERDVTTQISQKPNGGRLWCVWCDDKYPPPSARMLTAQEFVGGAK